MTGMAETREIRLRRLGMRSWRRGMREMDLLLGKFADSELAGLGDGELDLYEGFLAENDQDLYLWICRRDGHPGRYDALVRRIAAFHSIG